MQKIWSVTQIPPLAVGSRARDIRNRTAYLNLTDPPFFRTAEFYNLGNSSDSHHAISLLASS